MSVFFERGPQKDETKQFTMHKEKTVHELEETFNRVSTFYYDRSKSQWEEKILNLNLGFRKLGTFVSAGIITIDMGPMVDQGE